MAYTSFGTRKALGRRYGVDPALLLESERLQAEYNLAPGREARALQESQFARGMELQREGMKGAERGGMVGTAGNLATTAGVLRAMTMKEGESFFPKSWFGGASGAGAYSTGATQVAPGAFTLGGATPFASQTGTFVVNPALMGEGAAGITAGAGVTGAGATGAAVPAAAEAGVGAGMLSYAAPVAAGYVGGQIGQKLGVSIGESIGIGGRRERETVGGTLGGAAAGAAIGSIVPGVGTAIGAGVGALVGFVSSIFGW